MCKLLQDRPDLLVVPELDAVYNAGRMLEGLEDDHAGGRVPDLAEKQAVVGIAPKPQFYPLFMAACMLAARP